MTQAQTCVPIVPSATALQMEERADENGNVMYVSHLPGLERLSFFPYQVSGAATCLARMFSYIPLPSNSPHSTRDAASKLKSLQLGGAFICDSTGLGKTIMTLLVVAYAQFHVHLNPQKERIYKSTMISVPANVLKQWVTEIKQFGCFYLAVSYDRENGFHGWAFVRFLCRLTLQSQPTTAIDYINFVTQESPMIRALIDFICKGGRFLKPRKQGRLLALEDTPLIAMFIHWALNMIGINCVLFYAGLSHAKRNNLQDAFNNPSSDINVMVCLYDIGGVGWNFHLDCHTVFLTSSAKNQAAEIQAIAEQ